MKRLSRAAFDRARQFCRTQARPLDQELFEHRFEYAPRGRVMAELAYFQNEDGGFGRALEPDLRTPTSSALATSLALQLLSEWGYGSDEPLVHDAVQFLLSTFDSERQVWRVAPHDTNAFPHAPWWHDDHGSLADTFDGFQVIPRSEIVSLLYPYADLVPAGWLAELTERTVADIEAMDPRAFGGGGDALRYALDLAETRAVPTQLRKRLILKLRAVTPAVVSQDPDEWSGYAAAPLKIAPRPGCIVADLFSESIQRHLDYEIERQSAEGSWDPVWTWGDFYPDVWGQARQEWRGHLTVEMLTTLRAYGRIDAELEYQGLFD